MSEGTFKSVENVKCHVLADGKEYVTYDYGTREPSYREHHGMDLQCGYLGDSDIVAIADGEVINCMDGVTRGDINNTDTPCGNFVKIKHSDGKVSRYLHMVNGSVTKAGIRIGTKVKKGQVLGHMGVTGQTTGLHLHFDVKVNDEFVDPLPYLQGTKTIGNSIVTENKDENVNKNSVITVGDKVTVNDNATDRDGNKLADFVFNTTFDVLNVIDNQVLIGFKNEGTTAWVFANDVTKINSNGDKILFVGNKSLVVGCKVRVLEGAKNYDTGKDLNMDFYGSTDFDVIEVFANRVVIGIDGNVTVAVHISYLHVV